MAGVMCSKWGWGRGPRTAGRAVRGPNLPHVAIARSRSETLLIREHAVEVGGVADRSGLLLGGSEGRGG